MIDPLESAINLTKLQKNNLTNSITSRLPGNITSQLPQLPTNIPGIPGNITSQLPSNLNSVTGNINRANITNAASSAAITAATAALPPGLMAAKAKLDKLPITKDPELAKKQLEAELQKKKGELTNKLQQEKNNKIEELKNRAASIIPPALGIAAGLAKKSLTDPKIMATLSFLKQLKQTREKKQSESKENLKKAKEMFTFPMKLVNQPEATPTASISSSPIPTVTPNPSPTVTVRPTPLPTATPLPEIPAGIAPADWKRFGRTMDREISGDVQAVKNAMFFREQRRAEIIKIQEDRVARAKRFVDFQSERYGADPSLKPVYDNALKVYFAQRRYLEKVRNDPSILDLTE